MAFLHPSGLVISARNTLKGGQYRVVECYGSSLFGLTVRVRETRGALEGKDWAVKLIPLQALAVSLGATSLADARREAGKEAEKMISLTHDRVVRSFEHWEEAVRAEDGRTLDCVCLKMQLCPGGTLARRIAEMDYSLATGVRWVREVAEALAYVHGKRPKITHGDLKPENVCLDAEGSAVVIDWAGSVAIFTRVGSDAFEVGSRYLPLMGTAWYMSPERLERRGYYWEDDIWALGLIGLQLVLKRECVALLPASAPPARRLRDLAEFVEEAKGVDAEVGSLLEWCLQEKAEDRPTAAEVVRLLSGEVTLSGLRAPIESTSSPSSSRVGISAYEARIADLERQLAESLAQTRDTAASLEMEVRRREALSGELVLYRAGISPPRSLGGAAGSEASSVFSADELGPSAPGEPDSLVGTIVGTFKVLQLLGKGAFGKTYEAEGVLDGARFALKRVPCASDAELSLLRRETRLMSTIPPHRNVVQYFSSFVSDIDGVRTAFIIMKLGLGGSLSGLIRRRSSPFSCRVATHIVCGIAAGLAHLHSLRPQVLHRDLKPGNVVLTEDGVPMIADFGTSLEAFESLVGHSYSAGGTMFYKSIARREGEACGAEDDIFALGIIALEVMTGRPMWGEDARSTLTELSDPLLPKGRRLLRAALDTVASKFGPLGPLVERMLRDDGRVRPTALEIVATLGPELV